MMATPTACIWTELNANPPKFETIESDDKWAEKRERKQIAKRIRLERAENRGLKTMVLPEEGI